jgi:hypothetical protein
MLNALVVAVTTEFNTAVTETPATPEVITVVGFATLPKTPAAGPMKASIVEVSIAWADEPATPIPETPVLATSAVASDSPAALTCTEPAVTSTPLSMNAEVVAFSREVAAMAEKLSKPAETPSDLVIA